MNKNNSLACIFDSSRLGYGWDFGVFIILAELKRVELGLKAIDLIIIKQESNKNVDYLNNIVLEIVKLLQSINQINITDKFNVKILEEYNYVFPEDIRNLVKAKVTEKWHTTVMHRGLNPSIVIKRSKSLKYLSPSQQNRQIIRRWFQKNVYPKFPVTITLRECETHQFYNSDLKMWQYVINNCIHENIKFIILRDYSKIYNKDVLCGKNVIHYDAPVLQLGLRAALYQEAFLNLFVGNGTFLLAQYNPLVRYVMFIKLVSQPQIDLFNGVINKNKNFRQRIIGHHTNEKYRDIINKMLSDIFSSRLFKRIKPKCNKGKNLLELPSVDIKGYTTKYMELMNPDYLNKRIDVIIKNYCYGKKKILLYGAGLHTRLLFKFTNLSRGKIFGIVDKDRGKQGLVLNAIRIYSPENIKEIQPDVIIISSNSFQEEIFKDLKTLITCKIEIVKIYNKK